jgi:uncharacterized alpha-E superfamily protein
LTDETGFENVRAAETLAASQRGPKSDEDEETAEEFVNYAVEDKDGGGIAETVSQIQSIARVLRDRLPADCWRILQECYLRVSQQHDNAEEPSAYWMHLLQDLLTALAAFSGLAADSMMHSQSWRFLDMGRRLERAISIVLLLGDTIVNPGNDPALLEAILEITESSFPYRRKYLTRFENCAVADLLVAEASNPRSVAFQLATIAQHFEALPHDPNHRDGDRHQQILRDIRASIQSANLTELCEVLPDQPHQGLGGFLSRTLNQMMLLSDAIAHLYFSHATVSRALAQDEGTQ